MLVLMGVPSSYLQYLQLVLTVCLVGIVIKYSNFYTTALFLGDFQ
jgi:hypothetical protein